ncbi:hypothetical protein RND71_043372 [Anisodus tanguticus]|uniref:ATP-dependent Clp protease proteolytic subunit n=1 Tax=Anisodus tanguticus TaxID=243964 RepID=A0AAE1QNS8_9SOLA|nr:hypothetical protein RND71_043372 [Anisodus tanguticus]
MASLLLAAGTPGMRHSLPHSRVMLHQPSGGVSGQATDIFIHTQEILKIREMLYELYVKHTKLNKDQVAEHLERDKFLSPDLAKEYGIIDVTSKPQKLKKPIEELTDAKTINTPTIAKPILESIKNLFLLLSGLKEIAT